MNRWCCDELMVFCGVIDYDNEAKREWECIECGRRIAEPYNPTLPAKSGDKVLLERIKELETENAELIDYKRRWVSLRAQLDHENTAAVLGADAKCFADSILKWMNDPEVNPPDLSN